VREEEEVRLVKQCQSTAVTDMKEAQRNRATAVASSGPRLAVLTTLTVCGAGGAIATGIVFAVQYFELPISAAATRLLLVLLWLGVFTTLLYVNRGTLSSVGTGAGRRFGLGVTFALIAALVLALAVMAALTAHVNLGGRL
jgi:hypothetical protein